MGMGVEGVKEGVGGGRGRGRGCGRDERMWRLAEGDKS